VIIDAKPEKTHMCIWKIVVQSKSKCKTRAYFINLNDNKEACVPGKQGMMGRFV
jgi:hypothetical protein